MNIHLLFISEAMMAMYFGMLLVGIALSFGSAMTTAYYKRRAMNVSKYPHHIIVVYASNVGFILSAFGLVGSLLHVAYFLYIVFFVI